MSVVLNRIKLWPVKPDDEGSSPSGHANILNINWGCSSEVEQLAVNHQVGISIFSTPAKL